jgi:hypothetical protein
MTVSEKQFDRQSGAQTYEEFMIRASRNDAMVQIVRRAHPSGGWAEMKTITDLQGQKRVVIDPLTESLTTYKLSALELSHLTAPPANCGAQPGSAPERVAGYEAFRIVHNIAHPEKPRHSEQWLAPGLNCLPVRETFVDDTTGKVLGVREAQFVIVGRPPDTLFAVPQNYKERSPSEVFAEHARRFPGRSAAPAKTGDYLDQAYHSHQ